MKPLKIKNVKPKNMICTNSDGSVFFVYLKFFIYIRAHEKCKG